MSTATRHLYTYEDLERLPDDGRRFEIIDGELIELTSPSSEHQLVSAQLFRELDAYVTRHGVGTVLYAPLDIRLSPHNIVQPDLVYLSRARFPVVRGRPIEGAPDLVVEILSPSTRERDLEDKLALYARYGVPEHWIADLDALALPIYAPVNGGYELVPQVDGIARSLVLPGLTIDVADLYAGVR